VGGKIQVSSTTRRRRIINLYGFIGDEIQNDTQGIPFSLLDYIELVDWSGCIIREDKRGVISSQRPRILFTLGLDNNTSSSSSA